MSNKTLKISLVIISGCLLYMMSGGIRVNSGIVLQSLASRTGISYEDVSFVAAIGQLMYGLTQPFFGILAMKKSNGFVLVLGVILMSLGLVLTPLCHSMLTLILTFGILFFSGTGAVCFGIIMGTISPILKEKASLVSGLLNASSGIGGSILSPIMQSLQVRIGVGNLFFILSIPVMILIPVCIWLSHISEDSSEDTQTDIIRIFKIAIKNPDYQKLMIGFSTCGFHMCIIQTHIYSQIVSYGISESIASYAYTVFGITSMIGSVLCGLLCQKFHFKTVLGSLYGIRAVIVGIFLFLLPKTVLSVFLFIIILGMTGDATVTPTSEIISKKFGPESLGFLFGMTFVVHQIGGFISSWLGGIFINSGNYTTIWVLDIIVCMIASIASYRVTKSNGLVTGK